MGDHGQLAFTFIIITLRQRSLYFKILYGITSLVFLGEEFGGFLFVVCVSLGRRGGWG